MQLRGGLPRGTKLLWEINGTHGDLRITAANEFVPVINISPLRVEGGRKGEEGYRELDVPKLHEHDFGESVPARNVAGIYRLLGEDLLSGSNLAPSFDDAVALHKVVDAIERSDQSGTRVRIG
jgi:predicted dehydrogenase